MTARLGIGIPVYNGERFLPRALASLQAQTYPDFEVLILDNGSTDGTQKIAEYVAGEDPRFRYERKAVTTGGPANFNDAFQRMDNELFAWCADDDLHHPAFYATCVALLDAHPEAIGAFTAVEIIDEEDNWVRDEHPQISWDDPDPGNRMVDLIGFKHGCHSVFSVMRRPALAAAGPMCTCWGSDRVLLSGIALQGLMVTAPERYFRNRDHAARLTHGKGRNRSFYGTARPQKALTFHYAAHLRRAVGNATHLDAAQRKSAWRAYRRWLVANTGNLARSAARAVLDTIQMPKREPITN